MEFWFEFASTYSYIAAMRVEAMCREAGVDLLWRPFLLGPIFNLQGWETSPFVLNERRGNYMWRDIERLTAKYGLPFERPGVFPRNTLLACRVAAAFQNAPWIGEYVRAAFVANFGKDCDLNDETVIERLIASVGQDPQTVLHEATHGGRDAMRRNTERAIEIGIFGAPNCVVGRELFWGEETLEDAIAWARRPHAGTVQPCISSADS